MPKANSSNMSYQYDDSNKLPPSFPFYLFGDRPPIPPGEGAALSDQVPAPPQDEAATPPQGSEEAPPAEAGTSSKSTGKEKEKAEPAPETVEGSTSSNSTGKKRAETTTAKTTTSYRIFNDAPGPQISPSGNIDYASLLAQAGPTQTSHQPSLHTSLHHRYGPPARLIRPGDPASSFNKDGSRRAPPPHLILPGDPDSNFNKDGSRRQHIYLGPSPSGGKPPGNPPKPKDAEEPRTKPKTKSKPPSTSKCPHPPGRSKSKKNSTTSGHTRTVVERLSDISPSIHDPSSSSDPTPVPAPTPARIYFRSPNPQRRPISPPSPHRLLRRVLSFELGAGGSDSCPDGFPWGAPTREGEQFCLGGVHMR